MNDVKSAKRVLEILRFFAEAKEPASLARISSALNFPKSSCLALMETLVAEGYAYQTDGRYYLTGRWQREADIVARHDRLALRCRPTLQRLSDDVGETVLLAQLAHDQVVYLDVIEADHVLRFTASVGQRKPLHASASGRALL
ncbi:MAG: helix-turn-helix domain-containing protein, partial [Ramlibacter sp.]